MDKKKEVLARLCDCGCCTFVVDKTTWDDGEISFEIVIQDGRYDHDINTFWGRLKRAFSALFGKAVYFNGLYLEAENYAKLCADMQTLLPESYTTKGNTKELQD